ncbi:uncharacterized protein TNCV_4453191 [Trichonephila clavipes]|nr:uncharacterized protein TNCV_4453191 [Trichonephila clavipes]
MSDGKVQKCVRKCKDGRRNVHDEECSGRPSVITDDLMPAVETKIPEYKEKRFSSSLDVLIRYEEEGDDMLRRTVTGEEIWVFDITPESKQQSMELATHILSLQGQSQTNVVKSQDYDNNGLGPMRCFAGGLYATRNNDKKCLLLNSMEAPKCIAKQMVQYAVKRCFAPPR